MTLLESSYHQSAPKYTAKDSKTQEYLAVYNPKYDFLGQSYASMYPNLHKYPATMLPQIGLELLKEFKAQRTNLLDPYCGSGSSFVSGLEYGIKDFIGFDLNPLAIMIAKARMTYIESCYLIKEKEKLLCSIESRNELPLDSNPLTNITNIHFWIEKNTQRDLLHIFACIKHIRNKDVQNLFLLAFSETLRECSYTRNNEFKLFRMKDYEKYKPDVYAIFTKNIESLVRDYLQFYEPKLQDIRLTLANASFHNAGQKFDILLTSPPYGDSKTTVAYGQFSTFINEWLGFKEARRLDSKLMGGKKANKFYDRGLMKDYIFEISAVDKKRALEVSSFYFDLQSSIQDLIDFINAEGKVFFIVGNRRVKNIELPTDKFIAEVFCNNGFRHLQTIKRRISNKSMPLQNSPSNKSGFKSSTMNKEYIVVCEKMR